MDVALKRPPVVGDEDDAKVGKKPTTIASEMSFLDRSSRPCSSNTKDWITANKEDQLESTRAEMGQVREENKRLKTILARIVKDYKSLQTHFFDVVQHEQVEKPTETSPVATQDEEEQELVSLCLGTSSRNRNNKKEEKAIPNKDKERMELDEVLTLGLDSKYERSSDNGPIERAPCLSPENSSEDSKDQEAGEPWPPSKVSKNSPRIDDDEASQQTHVKKTRVSVRARCDAPTMNDGCQWRKYGQKVAKGNPCPRAYYRCTVAPACPVRKQVQRCAEDMSILITTYEGTHNHLLPISATAMVSTTSAAACMLSSGSSASHPLVTSPSSNTMNTPTLNNLSFNVSDTSRPNYQPYQSNRPTVTLDLTSPSSQFINRFSSPLFTSSIAKYSSTSTNFNFSSTNGSSSSSSYFNHGGGGTHQPCNTETQISSLNFGRQSSYMARGVTSHQRSLTDTIAKAITADPSFQSALAAAITSYVGCQGGNGGAPGYLSRSNSSGLSREQGSLVFGVQSSASMAFFSGSNSSCASTVENKRENAN